MYVYSLIYHNSIGVGYFSSYKKARAVKKQYQSTLPGFKDHQHGFKITKIKVNFDNYYFLGRDE